MWFWRFGTRLNPFSTLPGYGIDYWPKDAKIIQVDINPDRIGLTEDIGRHLQRAKQVAQQILDQMGANAGNAGRDGHKRSSISVNPPGCSSFPRSWIMRMTIRARIGMPVRASARRTACRRQAWRAIQAGMPKNAIMSTDIGNNCAIRNAYPNAELT